MEKKDASDDTSRKAFHRKNSRVIEQLNHAFTGGNEDLSSAGNGGGKRNTLSVTSDDKNKLLALLDMHEKAANTGTWDGYNSVKSGTGFTSTQLI